MALRKWPLVAVPLPLVPWAFTLGPFVFGQAAKDVLSDPSLYAHEAVHSKRQIAYGVLPWLIAYATSKEFRRKEELLAYEAEVIYCKQNHMQVDRNRYIEIMAGEESEKIYGIKLLSDSRAVNEWLSQCIAKASTTDPNDISAPA